MHAITRAHKHTCCCIHISYASQHIHKKRREARAIAHTHAHAHTHACTHLYTLTNTLAAPYIYPTRPHPHTHTHTHGERARTHIYTRHPIHLQASKLWCMYLIFATVLSFVSHTRTCIHLQKRTFTCIPWNISIHVFVSICNLACVYGNFIWYISTCMYPSCDIYVVGLLYFDAMCCLSHAHACIYLQCIHVYIHTYIHHGIPSICTCIRCDIYICCLILISFSLHTRTCMRAPSLKKPSRVHICVCVSMYDIICVYDYQYSISEYTYMYMWPYMYFHRWGCR